MSYLALARAALLRGNERSEEREKSEENHAQREDCPTSTTEAWDSSHISLSSRPYVSVGDGAANNIEAPLEPVGVVLDDAGDPAVPCATCGGRSFHQAPGDHWRCSACEPPTLPSDGAAMAGWMFCALPLDPDDPAQNGPPEAPGGAQDADSASARPGGSPRRPKHFLTPRRHCGTAAIANGSGCGAPPGRRPVGTPRSAIRSRPAPL